MSIRILSIKYITTVLKSIHLTIKSELIDNYNIYSKYTRGVIIRDANVFIILLCVNSQCIKSEQHTVYLYFMETHQQNKYIFLTHFKRLHLFHTSILHF